MARACESGDAIDDAEFDLAVLDKLVMPIR